MKIFKNFLIFTKQSFFYALLGICVIIFGIYVGNILFGNNSLEVLLDLKKEKITLFYDIQNLQNANAKMQKEYFELKTLEPQ